MSHDYTSSHRSSCTAGVLCAESVFPERGGANVPDSQASKRNAPFPQAAHLFDRRRSSHCQIFTAVCFRPHSAAERQAREMETCGLCHTPIGYLDIVCRHCQQPRRTPNRWAFLILLVSGVLGAYGLVLGVSIVDPSAAAVDIGSVAGFFGAIFVVDRIFRKVEHAHCERIRHAVTQLSGTQATDLELKSER